MILLAACSGAAMAQSAAQPAPQPLGQVRVLATGGTIAGAGNAAGVSYKSGVVGVADLIRAVPGVDQVATISAEQVANVASGDMDETLWRRLLGRVEAAIADPGVNGVVITHGTDTLEETAFFLSLLVPATKPVVLVGSMRPSTAISADGPGNLIDAIRVAVAPASAGRGVMVVMNDTIFDPTSVTKVDVRRVEAFAAPSRGPIGDVLKPQPRFFTGAVPAPPSLSLKPGALPAVAIVYAHAGLTGDDVRRIAGEARGVVIAGVGAGGFSTSARKAIGELTKRGVAVVRTPRQGHGDIWTSDGPDDGDSVSTIAGRELTPAKARILLMLALQERRDAAGLQALFDYYGVPAR